MSEHASNGDWHKLTAHALQRRHVQRTPHMDVQQLDQQFLRRTRRHQHLNRVGRHIVVHAHLVLQHIEGGDRPIEAVRTEEYAGLMLGHRVPDQQLGRVGHHIAVGALQVPVGHDVGRPDSVRSGRPVVVIVRAPMGECQVVVAAGERAAGCHALVQREQA